MEVAPSGMSRPSSPVSAWPGAGADDGPLGRPDALGGVELHAVTRLAHRERARGDDVRRRELAASPSIAARTSIEPPSSSRSASSSGRVDDGKRSDRSSRPTIRAGTPAASNAAARAAIFGPHTSTPSRPSSLTPSSSSSRSHPARALTASRTTLVVVTVPEHARTTSRLPRARRSRLEHPAPDPAPPKRVARRQPRDAGTDNSHLGRRNAHRPDCTSWLGIGAKNAAIPHHRRARTLGSRQRGSGQIGLRPRSPKPVIPGSSPGCPASDP